MGLTVSQLDGLDANVYGDIAAGIKSCVSSLQLSASNYNTQVLAQLRKPEVWSCALTTSGNRVAQIHADTMHHCIDALTIAYLALNQLGPDLVQARNGMHALLNDLANQDIVVADDGAATPRNGVPGPTWTPTEIAVWEYENGDAATAGQLAATATLMVRNALAVADEIDASCAAILSRVYDATSCIVVDTNNLALATITAASPPAIDALLAEFGDPLGDLGQNTEDTPGELEKIKSDLEKLDLAHGLTGKMVEGFIQGLKGSPEPDIRNLATRLEDNPNLIKSAKFWEKFGKGLQVATALVSLIGYVKTAPNTGVAIYETIVTSMTAIEVGAGTDAAVTALVIALGGGPEDLPADILGFIAGWVAAGEAAKLTTDQFNKLNEALYSQGADGTILPMPDPLKLSPAEIDGMS